MVGTPKAPAPRRSHPDRTQSSYYTNLRAAKDLKRLALDLDLRTNDIVTMALTDFAAKHGRQIDFTPPRLDDADAAAE